MNVANGYHQITAPLLQTPIQCVDYPPSNYTVTLMAEGSNDLLAPFPASGAVMESFTLTSVQGLMEDTRYSAMVTAANPFGSTTSTGEYVFCEYVYACTTCTNLYTCTCILLYQQYSSTCTCSTSILVY